MWTDVAGFEKQYEVHPNGAIRNKKTLRTLKPRLDRGGYYSVTLCGDDGRKESLVHRVVALAFLKKIEGKECVNHINGDKGNNDLSNIEWCSYSENTIHAYDKKLLIPYDRTGSKHPRVKVTTSLTKEVINFLSMGHTHGEASKIFKISTGTVSNILNKKTHLDIK